MLISDESEIPAFPQNTFKKAGDVAQGECIPGMTLQDYFAGKVLQGLYAGRYTMKSMNPDSRQSHCYMAEWAYAQADAMMEVRKERTKK